MRERNIEVQIQASKKEEYEKGKKIKKINKEWRRKKERNIKSRKDEE